jgi:hypothetical protein
MNAPAQTRLRPFFYTYSIPFTTANGNQIANGATATNSVQIEAGHHFVVEQFIFDARLTTAANLNPFATVQVVDLSSNLPLFDRPLIIASIFGTSQLPYVLPTPRRFRANGGISATVLQNTGGALDVMLLFAGQKVPVAGAAGAQG